MTTNQSVTSGMRPNIQISYEMNGRIKDYANRHDLSTPEAYRQIIEIGLAELEEREQEDEN